MAAVTGHGRKCIPLYCDVSDRAALQQAFDQGIAELGQVSLS